MKLKTKDLQELVTRVSRGAGNNKLMPITSLINILAVDDSLCLTTTDASNYFTVKLDDVESDAFEVSVNVDVFTKLVQKMTSEYISIEVLDNYLMVVGNGKYKIDLLLDETGNPVKFPNNLVDVDTCVSGTIDVATIKSVIANNKASLSVDTATPFLMNYYCGDCVISTDRYKICKLDKKLFESPQLLSANVMELLGLFSSETFTYYISDKAIVFDSANEYLYTPIVEGIEKMPISAIMGLIDTEMENNCELDKDAVMSVLDRLALFVSPYDKNVIYLTFTGEGLEITSKKSNGTEIISYKATNINPFEPYTCAIDIEMFRSQVNTVNTADVKLHFGSPIAVKITSENIVKIVALQEDERL